MNPSGARELSRVIQQRLTNQLTALRGKRPESGHGLDLGRGVRRWFARPSGQGHPPAVVVSTVIEAVIADVWDDVRHIASHVSWMHDAAAIRFVGAQTEGTGTIFECDTKIGPFSLTDVMEITSWEDQRRMGVRHVGLVTGVGEFTLAALGPNRTEFCWSEDLIFPWYMGGPIGAWVARPVLRLIWSKNLANLKARIEGLAQRPPRG